MDGPPTLRSIAALAGVSRQTVSDALRGMGRVSEATREKIIKLAEELNYQPDPLVAIGLAQMRRKSQHRFQSVLAFIETGTIPNLVQKYPAYRRMMTGVLDRAKQLGFGVETFWLGAYATERGRLENILRARGIKGVILLYVRDWEDSTESPLAFSPSEFACTTIGARLRDPELDFVCSNHYGNTRQALLKLQKRGHKKIGLMIPQGMNRLLEVAVSSAYEGWVREEQRRVRIPPFFKCGPDSSVLCNQIQEWIERYQPDAIYGLDPWNLVPRLLKKSGENIVWATMEHNHSEGDLCGTDQAHEEVGAAAVEVVYSQLTHAQYGVPATARGVLIEGHWIA